LFKERNLVQDIICDLFIQTHYKLLALAGEDELKSIVKQMNKLF